MLGIPVVAFGRLAPFIGGPAADVPSGPGYFFQKSRGAHEGSSRSMAPRSTRPEEADVLDGSRPIDLDKSSASFPEGEIR